MNYEELSDEEAKVEIMNRVGEKTFSEHENELIEPGRVLYYLDAFGDFEMALNVHVLPFDLPDGVIEEVANYDVLGGWEGEVNEITCPVCQTELYEFKFRHDHIYLGKYGGNYTESVWYLTDSAGVYWDSTGENNVMCGPCANDRRNFSARMDDHYGVKMFFGEYDSWWPFSYENGVIRWDAEWYMDNENCEPVNLKTTEGRIVGHSEVAEAFASPDWEDLDALMESLGWTEITTDDVTCTTNGVRRTEKYAKSVLEKWGSVTDSTEDRPTHPEWDFNYIIEDGRNLFCPEEHRDEVVNELNRMTISEVNQMDSLKKDPAGQMP